MQVTIYKNTFGKKIKDIPLSEVLRDIKNGVWFDEIFKLRKIRAKSSKDYDREKVNLMAFTPSATFKASYKLKNKRKVLRPPTKADLIKYNQLIIVDFDKLDEFDIHSAWQKVCRDQYTLAAFSSPSGAGLKILVRVNSDLAQHKEAFKTVNEYYTKLVDNKNISYDKSGSNVNRLCYVSSDANCTYNIRAKVFPVQTSLFEPVETPKEEIKTSPLYMVTQEKVTAPIDGVVAKFLKVAAKLERDGRSFIEGQRHEYIKYFAIDAFKYGVERSDAVNYCCDNFAHEGHGEGKTAKLVNWAYDTIKTKEFGIYAQHQEKKALTLLKQDKKEEPQYKAELFKEEFDLIETHSEAPPEYMSSDDIEELTADDKTQQAIKRMLFIEKALRTSYDFRKNIMLNLYEYKGKRSQKYSTLEADEYNSISRGLLLTKGVKSTPTEIKKIIESEFSPKKHPLRDLFTSWASLAEDGTDYIEQVASFVQTDAPKGLWSTVFKKWCVASVANAFVDPYCTNRYCVILTGAQQTGKSKFFKMIWPSKYPKYFYSGSIDFKNRDSITRLIDTFIIEIDEQLSTMDKLSEWETLKSMVSLERVKVRRMYATGDTTAPRISNFCGSVNPTDILQDPSGNTRFLTFNVLHHIDINKLVKMDMRKLWGQAYKLHLAAQRKEYHYLLTTPEWALMKNYQEQFKKLGDVHHLILDQWGMGSETDFDAALTTTQVWKYFNKEFPRLNLTTKEVGSALEYLGYYRARRKFKELGMKKREKVWLLKNMEKSRQSKTATNR